MIRIGRVALATLMIGCGSGESPNQVDGPATWVVEVEPVLSIGQVDGDPAYLLERVATAFLTEGGGVVVADRGSSSIRMFDSEGTFVQELGGQGEGPGEFQYISSARPLESGGIEVYDSGIFRLTRFDGQGAPDVLHFVGESGNPEIYLGLSSSGDHILAWIEQGPRVSDVITPDPMRIGRFGDDGRLKAVLASGTGLRRFNRSPIPFTTTFHGFLVGDRIYFTDGSDAALEVRDLSGDTLPELSLDLARVDPSQAWSIVEDSLAATDETAVLDRYEGIPRDHPVPEVAEVVVDDAGNFWMKHYTPATDSHALGGWAGARGGTWSVVDPSGRRLADVEIPAGVILLNVQGDRVVGVTRDELGVQRVVVHRFWSMKP